MIPKPSLLVRVYYFVFFFLVLGSCSSFKVPWIQKNVGPLLIDDFQQMTTKDYVDHLSYLKKFFLENPSVKVLFDKNVQKKKQIESYLQNLSQQLINNNETFFKNLTKVNVTVLDKETPLYFSLPDGEIFMTSGLIRKYIKHESVLMSILAYEMVRSEKYLYPKTTFFPTGYLSYKKMILFSRLELNEKVKIHKWAHYLIQRVGQDGEYYLSWLQTQNRNTADFAMQVGDVNLINREESLFKAFLIKLSSHQSLTNKGERLVSQKRNSSKRFYHFLGIIRDGR